MTDPKRTPIGPRLALLMRDANVHLHVLVRGHTEWDHATAWCWCSREFAEEFGLGTGLDMVEKASWRPL